MKYILLILLVLFASYTDIFLFRVGLIPDTPAYTLIPLFLALSILSYPLKRYFSLSKSHSFKFLLLLLFLSFLFGFNSKADDEVVIQVIYLSVISIGIYIYSFLFFIYTKKNLVLLFLIIAFLLLSGSVWYDNFVGLPKYNLVLAQQVRKGGFGENPNQAASGIKFLSLAILIFLREKKLFRNIFLVLFVGSIFLTFSRSGIVSTVVILFLCTFNNWKLGFNISVQNSVRGALKIILLFGFLYILLLSLAEIIKRENPAFTRGAAGQRMELLLGRSDKGIINKEKELGRDSRAELFGRYLNLFYSNPLGMGTGYTFDRYYNKLKPHNYYLVLAIDFGIIGLLLFLLYLSLNLKLAINQNHFFYFTFFLLLVFEGFISHNIMYERSILICLAFFDSEVYRKKLLPIK